MEEQDKAGALGSRLNLNSLENTRKSFTKLIRQFYRDEIAADKFRALAYGLAGLLQYWKTESDQDLALRIEEVEKLLAKSESAVRVSR